NRKKKSGYQKAYFLPLVVGGCFLEGNGTGMRNWIFHAFVKKNISPSPWKLSIHERGMYKYRGG
ncbi:hypothetical protein, partial [Enterocloster bolteae]|uniref:hypothetical protein n=1 Tax=Enterocloster bolteae TaxID=208479 RepID=UPI001D099BF2